MSPLPVPSGGVAVAVDVVVLSLRRRADDSLEPVFLARRREREPYQGDWALPGVIVREGENLEDAVRRALSRATSPDRVRHLEQLATFGEPGRDPRGRVLSVSHLALLPEPGPVQPGAEWLATDPARAGGGIAADGITADGIAADGIAADRIAADRIAADRIAADGIAADGGIPLAFDHGDILSTAVERLRGKLSYSNVAYGLLPDEFTLSELQAVYEAVLGRELDKRNFRKKVLSLDLVTETGGVRRGAHRPAQLYRFRRVELVLLEDVIGR